MGEVSPPATAAQDAPRPGTRRSWRTSARLRLLGTLGAVVLGALAGALVAVSLGARVQAPIGPFDATISARPSFSGNTIVRLGPLGTIEVDTHDAPVTIEARVDELRVGDVQAIAQDLGLLGNLEDDVARDARAALWALVRRAFLAAVVGGAIGGLAVSRRWSALVAGGTAGALLAAAVTVSSAASFRPEAIAEPRYTGLLTVAPTAVGDARALVTRFGEYRAQLAEFVGNVLSLYRVTQNLPTLSPSADLVRVLHVSDVHLNPQAYDLMRELAGQFELDAIVDTGDSTDFGTSVESRAVQAIGQLGVPYLWVKGNHDSAATVASMEALPNVAVLDGEAAEIEGIRFFGVADPRFTPDKSQPTGSEVEEAQADAHAPRVARMLRRAQPPDVDVLVVHDERIAARSGDLVPLILAGHTHEPRLDKIGDATLLVQGSTGGAGRRGVDEDREAREPLVASVLYFDRETARLLAYDQVTVEGLGSRGVRVDRRTVEEPEEPDAPARTTTTDDGDDGGVDGNGTVTSGPASGVAPATTAEGGR